MKKNAEGKYVVELACFNCGRMFGEFTISEGAETLPICPECKKTRKRVKR